jgi:hypothetical protein
LIKNISLIPGEGNSILPGNKLVIKIELFAKDEISNIGIELFISHDDTIGTVFATNTKTRKNIDVKLIKGDNILLCEIENLNLCSGLYTLGFGIDKPFVAFYFYDKEIMYFEIEETKFSDSHLSTLPDYGHFYLNHNWIIN